jgi:hypothetical protein
MGCPLVSLRGIDFIHLNLSFEEIIQKSSRNHPEIQVRIQIPHIQLIWNDDLCLKRGYAPNSKLGHFMVKIVINHHIWGYVWFCTKPRLVKQKSPLFGSALTLELMKDEASHGSVSSYSSCF